MSTAFGGTVLFIFHLAVSGGDERWLAGMMLALRILHWDWDGYCSP